MDVVQSIDFITGMMFFFLITLSVVLLTLSGNLKSATSWALVIVFLVILWVGSQPDGYTIIEGPAESPRLTTESEG